MKILAVFINIIYWLGLFIVPSLISCFGAFWLYASKATPLVLCVIIGLCGVIAGIVIAEYVRRKFGLNNFWSGVSTNLKNDQDNDKENKKQ